MIVRGSSNDEVSEFVKYAKTKDNNITTESDDYTNGSGFSAILKGRKFYRILWSLCPIPKGQEVVEKDGEYYSLASMGCDVDPRIDDESIAYYSDLLIGTNIEIK